jgi:hypothetical protein
MEAAAAAATNQQPEFSQMTAASHTQQGVAAPVSSRLVCQPCFMCQLLHHCVNDSLLLYTAAAAAADAQYNMHARKGAVTSQGTAATTLHALLLNNRKHSPHSQTDAGDNTTTTSQTWGVLGYAISYTLYCMHFVCRNTT